MCIRHTYIRGSGRAARFLEAPGRYLRHVVDGL
jgi:hypothetical protein